MLTETYRNLTDTQAIAAFHATARLKGINVRRFALVRNGAYVTIRQKV